MDLGMILKERRSIRRFREGAAVDPALVEEILQAAVRAPSWKNSQAAGYYVVMSKEMLDKVKTSCLPELNQRNCKDAPVPIVAAFVKNHSGHGNQGNPVDEVGNGWGCYGLGPHGSHLILEAKDLGLDTLVMGIRDADALRGLPDIDQDQEVVFVIAVGYRDIDPVEPDREGLDRTARFY